MRIALIERAMTDSEFAFMNSGFHAHAVQHSNPVETQERFGLVALDEGQFVGCASALAYRYEKSYGNWCYLTDLFVEESRRKHGLGAQLLQRLEDKVRSIGVTHIYTWTAGYEAPGFYKKQGYQVFTELANWYQSGHARVGLSKKLAQET